MAPKISPVIKTRKGKKTIYTCDGKILRTSVRDYKYVLFGLSRMGYVPETKQWVDIPDGVWLCVGFGNNAQRLVSSWKNIVHYNRFEVVEIKEQ